MSKLEDLGLNQWGGGANWATKVAFACYAVAVLLIALSGIVYLFRTEVMPYHAEALGKSWAELDAASRILGLAFLKTVGGAWLATALAIAIMLFGSLRKQPRQPLWTIPVIGLVAELPALYAAISVTRHTRAATPWPAALLIVILFFAGWSLSLSGKKRLG